MRRIGRAVLGCALGLAVFAAPPARAEEGGTGHYPNGFMGYQAGIVPSQAGLYYKNSTYLYDTGTGGQKQIPIGGLLAGQFRASAAANLFLATYVSGKFLGGNLASTIAIPVLWLDSDATIATPFGGGFRNQNNLGLGDLYVAPVTVGWENGNHHWQVTLGMYAPTGAYKRGSIAPLSKNFWTAEPGVGYTYLNPQSGWEASFYSAIDINSQNPATQYTSGHQFHVDFVVAKHTIRGVITPAIQKVLGEAKAAAEAAAAGKMPGAPPAPEAEKGSEGEKGSAPKAPKAPKVVLIDVAPGIGGYAYQQLTGDSGPGARFGPFQARVLGLGPAIQGQVKMWNRPVFFELKVMKEFGVQNRFEGTTSWANITTKL